MNLHYHSGAAGGSWQKPSLTIRRLVRGVALCAILLELAASSVTKAVHEKAASYYAWDTIRPLGASAHRLCRLIWIILHRGVRYEERGQAVCKRLKRIRIARMIDSSEASATASNR